MDMSPRGRTAAALLLGAFTLAGCRSAGAPPPGAGSGSLAELEALYQARMDSTRLSVHPADVAFMTGMIGHHAQALVMSAWAPVNGANESVQTLAARIINAQKDEIGLMQRWLGEREQPVPQVDPSGRMADAGGHDMQGMHGDHAMMPGMLSQAQLDELEQARGSAFDRLFLTYMIQHHKGAITMVHDLFEQDGAAQDDFVFKLASDIQVDQTTEVARMQRMLDAMTGTGS
ncbi:MAG: DUF305 domain-containing protein [Gemmatimonadota bacterium]|nr:DUF305 domain-containing protein [Gemmatimonadota bacterium]